MAQGRQPARSKPERPSYFSNVPISEAIPSADGEIRQMGGFAWTEDGIRVAMSADAGDALAELRASSDQIGRYAHLDADGSVARG